MTKEDQENINKLSKEPKYKLMTNQLRITHSAEDVAGFLRWVIQSDTAKEYWQSHLTAENARLREALDVCSKSLATYGSHPIIEMQVKQALTTSK